MPLEQKTEASRQPTVTAQDSRWRRTFALAGVLPRLGLENVIGVAGYRLGLRIGWWRRALPEGDVYPGPFFAGAAPQRPEGLRDAWLAPLAAEVAGLHDGRLIYFGRHEHTVGSPPDWFCDPFASSRHPGSTRHWTAIGDFAGGDIKIVWEASRFGWAPKLARLYAATSDEQHLCLLEAWVTDWVLHNPVNRGPNWKCGQETSIRLLNVLLAAWLTNAAPTPALVRFTEEHLARVAATFSYALAQNNNHGTSEAAALLIAGSWLANNATSDAAARGQQWASLGRSELEALAQHLIDDDGGFSQHSVTYHRVLLDTLSLVSAWVHRGTVAPLSAAFNERVRQSTEWLRRLVSPENGDAPNLGANDGAQPFMLASCDYRDFRPTIQLASAAFGAQRVFPEEGPWDEPLHWLGLSGVPTSVASAPQTCLMANAGYLHIVGLSSRALLRLPAFRFRPSQADIFHLDLWTERGNMLRDGGSYSYNAEPWDMHFASAHAHNTVAFDDHDQMIRLGRFLFGGWPKLETTRALAVTPDGVIEWAGLYRDAWGCVHKRVIHLDNNTWEIRDRVSGFERQAVLRWRLAPGDWEMVGRCCASEWGEIVISGADVEPKSLQLSQGWESRYYLERIALPVLEISVTQPGTEIITRITIK